MKPKLIQLNPADLANIETIKNNTGATNETEIIRMALKIMATGKNIFEATPIIVEDEIQEEEDIFAGMNEYQIQAKLVEMEREAKKQRVDVARERMSNYQDSKGAATLKEILTKNPVKETIYEPMPSLMPRPVESWPDGVDVEPEY